jgi:hypothetical protein
LIVNNHSVKKHKCKISIGCIYFAKVVEKRASDGEDFIKRLKGAATVSNEGRGHIQYEMNPSFRAVISRALNRKNHHASMNAGCNYLYS